MDACSLHPDRPAVGSCARCDRAVCLDCAVPVRGEAWCSECAIAEFAPEGGYAEPVNRGTFRWLRVEGPVLAGAGLFLASAFLPFWYRRGGDVIAGIPVPSYTYDAWGGPTLFAGVAAGVAILWIVVRRLWLRRSLQAVDAALAGTVLVLTLAGLATGRAAAGTTAGASWGFAVGVPLALLWAWAGIRRLRRAPRMTSGFID